MDTSPYDHDFMIDLNLRINFVIINFFQEMLIASQGCVVNLTNICGTVPDEKRISFSMAQAGIQMMTKSVALELAPYSVRVNCVSTTFYDFLFDQSHPFRITNELDKEARSNPMQRRADFIEVCKTIIHLTSQNSLKITGQVINVDGGKHLTTLGQFTLPQNYEELNFFYALGAPDLNQQWDRSFKERISDKIEDVKNKSKFQNLIWARLSALNHEHKVYGQIHKKPKIKML